MIYNNIYVEHVRWSWSAWGRADGQPEEVCGWTDRGTVSAVPPGSWISVSTDGENTAITSCLRLMTKKDVKWFWGLAVCVWLHEADQHFGWSHLRTCTRGWVSARQHLTWSKRLFVGNLCSTPLTFPFLSFCRWMPQTGLGAVLPQQVRGVDCPETEAIYSTVEKECLAIWWVVDCLRYYLLGCSFRPKTVAIASPHEGSQCLGSKVCPSWCAWRGVWISSLPGQMVSLCRVFGWFKKYTDNGRVHSEFGLPFWKKWVPMLMKLCWKSVSTWGFIVWEML